MDPIKDVAEQVIDEKKLSVIQKYWQTLIIILLLVALFFKDKKVNELNEQILNRTDEQLRTERADRKEKENFDQLIQRYDKQTEILKNPKSGSFSNDKTGKQHEKDGN